MKIAFILCDALRYDRVTPLIMPNLYKLSCKGIKHYMHFADGGTTKWSLPHILCGQKEYDEDDNFPKKLTAQKIPNTIIHSNAVLVNEEYQKCFNHHIDVGVEMAPIQTSIRNRLRKTQLWKKTRDLRKHVVNNIDVPYRRAENILGLAQKQLDKNSEGFTWIHLMDPHIPYTPPGLTEEEKLEANTLYEMVLKSIRENSKIGESETRRLIELYNMECGYMDQCIAEFVDGNPDTLFIFTSDHGEMFGENDSYSHGPYYHGMTLQLGHVPLIIYGERVEPRNITEYTASIDTGSTILDLFDIPLTQGYGKTLRRLWKI